MKRKKRAFILVEVILAISLVTTALFYLIRQLREEYLQKIEALCLPELERIAHNRLAEILILMMNNQMITWEKLTAKNDPLFFSNLISIPLGPDLKMTFTEKINFKSDFKTIDKKNYGKVNIKMTYSSLLKEKSYSLKYVQFVERIPKPAELIQINEEK